MCALAGGQINRDQAIIGSNQTGRRRTGPK